MGISLKASVHFGWIQTVSGTESTPAAESGWVGPQGEGMDVFWRMSGIG